MAEMRNLIFGAVLFGVLVTGLYVSANDWLARVSSASSLDSSQFNVTGQMTYLGSWANDSTQKLSQAQAVPYLGGGLVLIQGAFQVVTLLLNVPGMVILPMAQSIITVLGLPTWFTVFIQVGIALVTVLGILAIMLARPV